MAIYKQEKGILVNPGDEPELHWYDLNGRMIELIRVEDLPLSLTNEDRARFQSVWAERIERTQESSRADARKMRDRLATVLPAEKPPWSYIAVDDAGYYWLRVQEEVEPWITDESDHSYRILSPDGEYLGITTTPSVQWMNNTQQLTPPVTIANSTFMAISENEATGGKLLQVYRIRSTVPEFLYP